MTSIVLECKLNNWIPHGAKLVRLVYPTSLSSIFRMVHTALTPTIGVGCLEWVDTAYINCSAYS